MPNNDITPDTPLGDMDILLPQEPIALDDKITREYPTTQQVPSTSESSAQKYESVKPDPLQLDRSPILVKGVVEGDFIQATGKRGFVQTLKAQIYTQFGIQLKERSEKKGVSFQIRITGELDRYQESTVRKTIATRVKDGSASERDFEAWALARDTLLSILKPREAGKEVVVRQMTKGEQEGVPGGSPFGSISSWGGWDGVIIVHPTAGAWRMIQTVGSHPVSKGEDAVSLPLIIIHEIMCANSGSHLRATKWVNQVCQSLDLAVSQPGLDTIFVYPKDSENYSTYLWQSPEKKDSQ